MRKTIRVGAVVVAAGVLAPAAAQAAAPWSAPSAYGAPQQNVLRPVLAFGADGNGLAGWNTQTSPPLGVPPAPNGSILRLTQGDGHGALRALPDTLVAGPALGAD